MITSVFLAEIVLYTEPQVWNKFTVILSQYSSRSVHWVIWFPSM